MSTTESCAELAMKAQEYESNYGPAAHQEWQLQVLRLVPKVEWGLMSEELRWVTVKHAA